MSGGKITKTDVEKIARLAKLDVSGDEEKYAGQLSEILDYVGKLNELDLEGVAETSQVTGLINVSAEDEVEPGLSQEEALSGTANVHEGYVKVPAIFGEEGGDA